MRRLSYVPPEGVLYKENFGIGSFFGETRTRSIASAVLTEVIHRRARQQPDHTHDASSFCLLLEGAYEERSEDTQLVYAPMTLAFHPAGMSHSDAIGPDGASFFMIELPPAWDQDVAQYGIPRTRLSELHGGDAAWLALRIHDAYCDPDTTAVEVESLLFELCSHIALLARDELSEPAWLRAIIARLDAEYYHVPGIRRLAADAGIHPIHLARTFRRFHQRTIGDYIMGLRIRDVCQALHETSASLATIALETGFADQNHLTRVFKAITKTTPARYRTRNAARAETPTSV